MNPAEEYILNQDEDLQNIMLFVRQLIFETLPEIEEKYKYKIPFYYYNNKPLCYLNVLKGTHYVDLGFWDGAKLSNQHGMLKGSHRKMVKSIAYHSLEDVNPVLLKEVLIEASSFKN